MNRVLFSMIVLAFGIATTQAVTVTCYNCVSVLGLNPDCEPDGFNGTYGTSSVTESTCDGYCIKKFDKIEDTITSMTRECSADCDAGCSSFFSLSGCEYCCNDGDLCNGASLVTLSHLAVVSSAVMCLFVTRL